MVRVYQWLLTTLCPSREIKPFPVLSGVSGITPNTSSITSLSYSFPLPVPKNIRGFSFPGNFPVLPVWESALYMCHWDGCLQNPRDSSCRISCPFPPPLAPGHHWASLVDPRIQPQGGRWSSEVERAVGRTEEQRRYHVAQKVGSQALKHRDFSKVSWMLSFQVLLKVKFWEQS